MDKQEIRVMTKTTYDDVRKDAQNWISKARIFYDAALLLNEHKDKMENGVAPFVFNASLATELLIKSVIVAQNSTPSMTHDLILLASELNESLSKNEEMTLEFMSNYLIWAGKYPAPKNEVKYNEWHDRTFERHIIRESKGNTHTTRANPDTIPNRANFIKLWEKFNSRFNEIIESNKAIQPDQLTQPADF